MKKMNQLMFAMLIIFSLSIALPSQAKIWRVNNFGTAVADFTTAQAAHDGANAGDTIYFESSPVSYGNLSCWKKLILIGTGYFLNENPETQSKIMSATLGSISFNTGSANSCIMGLTIHNNNVTINSSNIRFARNYIYSNTAYPTVINIAASNSNVVFSNNYLSAVITISSSVTNIVISNNIFAPSSNGGNHLISSPSSSTCLIQNNIFHCVSSSLGVNVYNSQIMNNIMTSGIFTPNNNTYTNNIGSGTQFGTANNNQQNIPASDIYLCTTSCSGYSTDGKWQLKAGSPAIGAGLGGADCGAFGGGSPYILSGMPNIPAIYYFTNFSSGNQLNVNLKVKSHN